MKETKEIKAIDENIKKLLEQGKDFLNFHTEFSEVLKELNKNHSDLVNNKRELLNFLLKHSKRKSLFEFVIEADKNSISSSDRKYQVGLNEKGLGIVNKNWENNFRNIKDYHTQDIFKELCSNKKFVKLFLNEINKHLRGKHKEIMKLLIEIDEETKSKKIEVGDIGITFGNYITYEGISEGNDINILGGGYTIKEKNLLGFNFSFSELGKYCYLLEFKPQIISKLKVELKEYKKANSKIKIKLAKVDEELKPYKALEEI